MKIYWSYKQFPELAGLSPEKKRELWQTFILARVFLEDSVSNKEGILVVVLIGSFILGMILGAFLCPNVQIGVFGGGIIGIFLPMPFFVIPGLKKNHEDFKVFMQTGDVFSLVRPNSEIPQLPKQKVKLCEISEAELRDIAQHISHDAAEAAEVMELNQEIMDEMAKLLKEIQKKNEEASKALKSFKLLRYILLEFQSIKFQSRILKCMRQSGRLFLHAKRSLDRAQVIKGRIQDES